MSGQDLESFLEKNKNVITSNNAKAIFRRIHISTKNIDWRILYDFLGKVLIEKPDLQKGKRYTKFLKGYNAFMSNRYGQLIEPPREVLEREKYFLEKYCIFESEEILCSFLGNVEFRKVFFSSRVFITNYRIIVLSHAYKPSSGVPFIPFAGLIFNMVFIIEDSIRKAMKTSVLKSVETPMDKPFFGYQFPISHPTAITLSEVKKGKNKGKAKSVKFTSKTETDLFDFSIYVNEKRHVDYEKILYKIAEILQNLQDPNYQPSMYCPFCGGFINTPGKFCPHCGRSLALNQQDE